MLARFNKLTLSAAVVMVAVKVVPAAKTPPVGAKVAILLTAS